jgi:hypothetical protein
VGKEGEEDSEIYIRSHPPVRLLPDGRPLLGLTVVDDALGRRQLAQGRIDFQRSVERFKSVIMQDDGPVRGRLMTCPSICGAAAVSELGFSSEADGVVDLGCAPVAVGGSTVKRRCRRVLDSFFEHGWRAG